MYKIKIFKTYVLGLDQGYFKDLYNSALVATINGIITRQHFINSKSRRPKCSGHVSTAYTGYTYTNQNDPLSISPSLSLKFVKFQNRFFIIMLKLPKKRAIFHIYVALHF